MIIGSCPLQYTFLQTEIDSILLGWLLLSMLLEEREEGREEDVNVNLKAHGPVFPLQILLN